MTTKRGAASWGIYKSMLAVHGGEVPFCINQPRMGRLRAYPCAAGPVDFLDGLCVQALGAPDGTSIVHLVYPIGSPSTSIEQDSGHLRASSPTAAFRSALKAAPSSGEAKPLL